MVLGGWGIDDWMNIIMIGWLDKLNGIGWMDSISIMVGQVRYCTDGWMKVWRGWLDALDGRLRKMLDDWMSRIVGWLEEWLDRMVCWSAEFNYVTPSHDSTQSIIKTSCLQISTQKKELKEKKKKKECHKRKAFKFKNSTVIKKRTRKWKEEQWREQ